MRLATGLLAGLAALRSSNGIAINVEERAEVEPRAAQTQSLTFAQTSAGYFFPLTADEQPFTVDRDAYYFFFVRGAAGGAGGADPATFGGQGAVVQGSYALKAGEFYVAVVGQKGGKGVGTPMTGVTTPEISAGGGGGGSFIYRPQDNVLMLAAGGGGGNSFNGTYIGQDAFQSDATTGQGGGGTAFPGAGGGGAGYNSAGANAGTVQGAKGGQTKLTWRGGAVDSRQTGAQGKGGFGGGGGGGKYSGGGGGGFTGGNGGPIPGNLGRPMSPGGGGTSAVRTGQFNGFDTKETQFTGQKNALDGEILILARPSLGGPFVPTAVPDILE